MRTFHICLFAPTGFNAFNPENWPQVLNFFMIPNLPRLSTFYTSNFQVSQGRLPRNTTVNFLPEKNLQLVMANPQEPSLTGCTWDQRQKPR